MSLEITPAPQLSFFNRIIGIYFSPGEVFADIGRSAGILPPLLLLLIVTVVSAKITLDRIPTERLMSEQVERMVEEGRLTAEQARQQQEQMAKIAPYTRIIGVVTAGLLAILLPLLLAGLAKLGLVMVGNESQFSSLWSVSVYAQLAVSIITTILFTAILLIKSPDEMDLQNPLYSNVAALLSLFGVTGLPKFFSKLLTYVDIFFIWKIILHGIGYAAVVPRLNPRTSLAICGGLGLLLALAASVWSALFG